VKPEHGYSKEMETNINTEAVDCNQFGDHNRTATSSSRSFFVGDSEFNGEIMNVFEERDDEDDRQGDGEDDEYEGGGYSEGEDERLDGSDVEDEESSHSQSGRRSGLDTDSRLQFVR